MIDAKIESRKNYIRVILASDFCKSKSRNCFRFFLPRPPVACEQDDSPERMADTRHFWKSLEAGVFDVCLSQVVFQEIDECYEPKRSLMYQHLNNISFTEITLGKEEIDLANKIISSNILPKNSADDSRHIACAVSAECDYIVSWNFKHLVNIKTIRGVRAISNLENARSIDIVTPSFFLNIGGENADD